MWDEDVAQEQANGPPPSVVEIVTAKTRSENI